jgi:hypothetical protein
MVERATFPGELIIDSFPTALENAKDYDMFMPTTRVLRHRYDVGKYVSAQIMQRYVPATLMYPAGDA